MRRRNHGLKGFRWLDSPNPSAILLGFGGGTRMAGIIEKMKQYSPEIALAGLYVYVVILAFATLKELGII